MKTVEKGKAGGLILLLFSLFLNCLVLQASPLVEEEKEKEDPPVATQEEAQERIRIFEQDFKAKANLPVLEEQNKIRAVRVLSKANHPLVAQRLERLLYGRQLPGGVRAAAAHGLGKMTFDREKAGKVLLKALEKVKGPPEILEAICGSLAELQYKKAYDALRKLIHHPDERVAKAAILTLGELKEWRVFDALVQLFQVNTAGDKVPGVSVRVDTGTAGPGDQMRAQQIGRSKQRKPKKARPDLTGEVRNALQKLTGEAFKDHSQLKKWMEENQSLIEAKKKEAEGKKRNPQGES